MQALNDNELNTKIKNLAAEERKLTQHILEHIAEVDRRRLHLRLAYPSLFEYLTREIGYSAGAAQRRIDAARLMQKIPEVGLQIETGRLNLGQISKIQQICREIKNESGHSVTIEKQKAVLFKIENQNTQTTDLILAQEFSRPVQQNNRQRTQKDESVRVEITFTKAEWELVQRSQQILSHQAGGQLKSTILEMARQILKQKKATATAAVKVNIVKQDDVKLDNLKRDDAKCDRSIFHNVELDNTNPGHTKPNKILTPKVRRVILKRDQYCQFQDPKTGRICGARHYLEVDHIHPKFAGGDNAISNLRVLCRNHNQYRYIAEC